jgi:peptidoglycan-N-acetylglucosamine deacetylase
LNYKLIKFIFGIAAAIAVVLFFLDIWPIWVFLLIGILYIVLILVLSTNVQLNYFVKAYNKNRDFPEKAVAISFDDGPVPNTLHILDILDKYRAKAAFFCIGENIEKHPEIFREILKRGHIVGNHTFSHTRKMGFLKTETILSEIKLCDEIAEETGGVKMNLFRPPFGIINPKTKRALQKTGHKVMGWNKRPYDAVTKSPDLIIARITKNLKKGDLILLHDNMPNTAPILEQLLVILEQRKFRTVRPDKLFDIHAYN